MRSAEQDVVESHRRVSHSPGRPTLVLMPVTQQKSPKTLSRSRHHLSHDAAQPDQVAHGFVIGVGYPNGGQLSGPDRCGRAWWRRDGSSSPPSPSFRGILDGATHVAPMNGPGWSVGENAITARAGLIAKRQRLAGTHSNLAEILHRPAASALQTTNLIYFIWPVFHA